MLFGFVERDVWLKIIMERAIIDLKLVQVIILQSWLMFELASTKKEYSIGVTLGGAWFVSVRMVLIVTVGSLLLSTNNYISFAIYFHVQSYWAENCKF
jgi:hypothetical protein